jgi:hypothetical protein
MPWVLLTHMIEEYSSMTNTDEKKEEIDITQGINIPGVKIDL